MVKGIYICKTNIDKADKEQSELLMGIMNFSKQTKSKKDKKKGAKKILFKTNFHFLKVEECFMMKMMMNCFCGMVDRRKACSLFPAGTIVRDRHNRKSPTRRKQDLNLFEFRLCLMKLCSSVNHYITAPL